MGLLDFTTAFTGSRRKSRRSVRPDAPRTIVPGAAADALARPRGATAPAGPLDIARLDAARDRLRREIAPVNDDE